MMGPTITDLTAIIAANNLEWRGSDRRCALSRRPSGIWRSSC